MRKQAIRAATLLGFLVAAGLSAQANKEADEQMRRDVAAQRSIYAAMPDTPGTGPYPAEKTVDPAFPDHVVYHPRNLAALNGRTLPVLLWGNGGCAADGAGARLFLAEIASHGYLAIAPGAILSGPGTPPPAATAQPAPLGVKTTFEQVRQGLDQAIAANTDRANPWFGKIDTGRVAVAGTSCGGLQALQVAPDPRIKAAIILHSGIFPDGVNPIAGMRIEKSILKTLHTPVLYILGGPMDVAYPQGTDDVARIEAVPVFLADHPVRHLGTFAQPNGGSEAQVTLDWLDWQLRGDPHAAMRFVGAKCGLCVDPGWTATRKGIR